MAKTKIIRELRLTFNEKDKDISEWLKGKSSQTAYIKDLLRLHKQIEQSYMSNGVNVEQNVPCETIKEDKVNDDFDFDLSDLGF